MKTEMPLTSGEATGVKTTTPSNAGAKVRGDDLAIDRTRMASERTLQAWVRTALSMIAFGFTLYKFLQAIQAQSRVPVVLPNAPRNVGLVLVGIGTFAVIVACVQHWKYMKKLHPDQPYRPWDLASIVAILIGLLGILIFASIIRTASPFG
jgi:putative membrane protein